MNYNSALNQSPSSTRYPCVDMLDEIAGPFTVSVQRRRRTGVHLRFTEEFGPKQER